MNALNLPPIDADAVKRLSDCPAIRWIGPDGGVRMGYLLANAVLVVAYDPHRCEVSILTEREWKYDEPKDDEGNAR